MSQNDGPQSGVNGLGHETKLGTDAIDAATLGADSPSHDGESLVELYRKWFDVVPATSPDLVELSHKLRYQVYCVETGFEKSEEFPDGCERDGYDRHSVCSLLIHKPSGLVAGTVRLILPQDNAATTPCLPVLNVSSDLSGMAESELPRAFTGEISRFAISKEFRKRREDSLIPAYYEHEGMGHDQRVIPHITLGLMQAILAMSIENGVSHLAILVEPALDRLIRKLGIYFTPVGPLIDHHGKRRVHMREIGSLLDEVYARKPEVWAVLTNAGDLWPAPPSRT